MAVKTKDLSNDEDYHSCIFLVNNAGLGKRTNAECQILSQELGAYGPRLSAWIDVYAADPTHGRSSVAYMRVVNTFLERWSPGKWPRGCEGFSYNTATTSFSISREVWEGLDAEFRGDFDAARKLFGRLHSCVSMAKVLTLMMVEAERKRKIWLKANPQPPDASKLSDALLRTPFGRISENEGYAPPPNWRDLLGNQGGGHAAASRDAGRKRQRGDSAGAGGGPDRERKTEARARARAPSPLPAQSVRRARAPPPFLARNVRRARHAETASGVSTEPQKCSQGFRIIGKREAAPKFPSGEPPAKKRMRARKRARSEGVPSATVVHEGAAAVNEDAAVEGAAARVVTDAAAAAPETRLGGPGKGDPLREEAVQHVAAMFREGVRSILWDGARRAREEKPEVGKE